MTNRERRYHNWNRYAKNLWRPGNIVRLPCSQSELIIICENRNFICEYKDENGKSIMVQDK